MASLHVSSNATSISWVQKLQKQCNICFLVGRILSGLNEALICLIPKGDAPYSLNQFRTISLCNVLLKVVSKIPANRLKLLMSKLTNHFQSSFILGRSTTNNIVLAQEVLHSLRWRKGQRGSFILNVDLKKSYDQID